MSSVLPLPFTICVILRESLNFSGSHFPYLQNKGIGLNVLHLQICDLMLVFGREGYGREVVEVVNRCSFDGEQRWSTLTSCSNGGIEMITRILDFIIYKIILGVSDLHSRGAQMFNGAVRRSRGTWGVQRGLAPVV